MQKTGLLLVNVGSPARPESGAVRRYLRQFLGDRRVLDLPTVLRWLLLEAIILPFRPRRSARAYREIWMQEGSPLIEYSRRFAEALQERLKEQERQDVVVALAMRYGRPSIAEALEKLRQAKATQLLVAPMYPQYAAATTASSLDEVFRILQSEWDIPTLHTLPPFFDAEQFIEPYARRLRLLHQELQQRGAPADLTLFSFHGLPERQIKRSDYAGQCRFDESCCSHSGAHNARCYRAQCFATARAMAQQAGIAADKYRVSFQSRLGRTPWIAPYTDELIVQLAREGCRSLAAVSPSFTADCLETLEELAMRGAASFRQHGGRDFHYLACPNDDPNWVSGFLALSLAASNVV
ncbi:MAG: ferrochelatase [Leptospirales bacterium]|nr:ferrochelatase [Leptospirales bacterium]